MKKYLLIFLLSLCMLPLVAQPRLYVWMQWHDSYADNKALLKEMKELKKHGVDGVCFNAGFDSLHIVAASKAAHKVGLEYHAWIPTMIHAGCDSTWYTVNRLGESAYDKPAYVSYYTTLDPHNPAVGDYLARRYQAVAEIPTVDYVQLDYIRYADVILAEGLWEKYGLIMNGEYPQADYCYCDACVSDFKQKTGIDIRKYTDPSKVKEWAQFRCDAVTALVNKLVDAVHAKGKKVSADVFPGPDSYARWMVRQEWNKWKVDALFPMNYNDFYMEPASWVGKVTAEEVQSVKGTGVPVYSGLFICKDWRNKDKVVDPENSGLLPSEMAEAVHTSLQSGAAGVSLFTPESMTPEHWAELKKALKEAGKK